MERLTARSPQDSSFLRTPSTHTFVTYSASSTSNLASTYRELPRAAIGNSSKCHLHDVRRYSRRVLPFVSGERFSHHYGSGRVGDLSGQGQSGGRRIIPATVAYSKSRCATPRTGPRHC